LADYLQAAALNVPTDVGDVEEFDQIIGMRISLAHAAVYRHFMETFSELELTQKQVAILWLVESYPGIAQTDIAKILRMDRATLMAIVNRLQARKYLIRGRSPTDKRRQTLVLGPEGQAMLLRAKTAIAEHEAWLKSRFTASEQQTLMELLKRIHA
jgi:DNA-binding MarR family transcriptional regulator